MSGCAGRSDRSRGAPRTELRRGPGRRRGRAFEREMQPAGVRRPGEERRSSDQASAREPSASSSGVTPIAVATADADRRRFGAAARRSPSPARPAVLRCPTRAARGRRRPARHAGQLALRTAGRRRDAERADPEPAGRGRAAVRLRPRRARPEHRTAPTPSRTTAPTAAGGLPRHDRRAAGPRSAIVVLSEPAPGSTGRRPKSPPGSRSYTDQAVVAREGGERAPVGGDRHQRLAARRHELPARRRRERHARARAERQPHGSSSSVDEHERLAGAGRRGRRRSTSIRGAERLGRRRSRRPPAGGRRERDCSRRPHSVHPTTASPRAETATSRANTPAGRDRDRRPPATAGLAQRHAQPLAGGRREHRGAARVGRHRRAASERPSARVRRRHEPVRRGRQHLGAAARPSAQLARRAGRRRHVAAPLTGPERQLAERRGRPRAAGEGERERGATAQPHPRTRTVVRLRARRSSDARDDRRRSARRATLRSGR